MTLSEEQVNRILEKELGQFNSIVDRYRKLLIAIGEL
jgi:hypothetical protein